MSSTLRLLQTSLRGLAPRPRRALGTVHLRLIGLDDESWTLEIAKAGVRVTPGAPSTAHVQLFCKRRDLDTLIDGPSTPKLDMLRFIGSREVLDHLALLLEAGNRLLAVRVRHQAHHFLEHFKEEELA